MAIAPIDIYRPQGIDPINSTLAGSVNLIGQILQNSLQIGRDNANNAMAQERDFLSERARLDSLAQRRGEFAATQADQQQRFGRSVYESDRNFLNNQQQFDRQQDRIENNDAFSQEQARAASTRALGAEQRDQQRLDQAIAQNNTSNAYRAAEFAGSQEDRQFARTREQSVEAERLRRLEEQKRFSDSLLNNVDAANSSVVTPQGAAQFQQDAQRDFVSLSAVDPAFAADRPDILRQQVGLAPVAKARTNADIRADEAATIAAQERAAKATEEELKTLVSDPVAFKPSDSKIKIPDKLLQEKNYALNSPSEEAYVLAGQDTNATGPKLTESELNARREFYRKVNGLTGNGITQASSGQRRNLLPSYLQPRPQ